MSASACGICEKHKNLSAFTGPVIAQREGWLLTHFPFLKEEKSSPGHLVLETRRHVTDFSELTPEELGQLGPLIAFGIERVKKVLSAEHVYVFRINDKAPHLHLHLIPRFKETPSEYFGLKILQWPERPALTLEQVKETAQRLRE